MVTRRGYSNTTDGFPTPNMPAKKKKPLHFLTQARKMALHHECKRQRLMAYLLLDMTWPLVPDPRGVLMPTLLYIFSSHQQPASA